MVVHHMFAILLYLHILQQSANCGIIPDITEEAPFQSLCSMKCEGPETKPAEEDTFPLFKCSCSPSCVVYGDCCYESQYKNATTWSKTDFICFSVVDRGQYRAVSGCAADKVSDFCKAGIGHLPLVTSKTTGTTYANIFCANCNGDGGNLVPWNVDLKCSTNQEIGFMPTVDAFVDSEDKIIYHLGHLWNFNVKSKTKSLCMYHVHYDDFSVIDSLELRHCYDAKMISDCSASWKDSEVMKQCRSYKDPVFFGDRVYKNYHCAECNYMSLEYVQCMPFHVQTMQKMGLIDSDVINFCKQRGYQSCIQYLSGMDKGRPIAISDLVNFMSEKSCVQPGKRCCPGERYDFRSKRCRQLAREKKKN